MRTTSSRITFHGPFILSGLTFPAGEYVVETDEEPLDVSASLAYRRTAVSVYIPLTQPPSGEMQIVTVTPAEFDAALQKDAAAAPPDRSPPAC